MSWENFFSKGPDCKYLRLCRLDGLLLQLPNCCCSMKAAINNSKWMSIVAVFQYKFIYKNRWWAVWFADFCMGYAVNHKEIIISCLWGAPKSEWCLSLQEPIMWPSALNVMQLVLESLLRFIQPLFYLVLLC